jgi:hypothetical protein
MSRLLSGRSALIVGLTGIAWGAYGAIRKTWLCDDAFISFRYAENLTHGLGLVYNAGERVEGYSNFLWTIWIAIGMRLGATPERWSVAWGVVFYVATLAVLFFDHVAPARGTPAPAASTARIGPALAPIACVLAAAHNDWQQYATGGLETSLFTFLVTAGYLLGVRAPGGVHGLAGSGLAFALAALTRPDGMLFVPIMGLYVLWKRRPRWASTFAFGGAFLAVWLPHAIWKLWYYGDVLPNTYYAKSAYLPWYDQGWNYVSLYFRRYWVLALALPVAAYALATQADLRERAAGKRSDAPHSPWEPRVATEASGSLLSEMMLALVLGLLYSIYIMHVGGDFMYARLLIPAAPFFAIALARGTDLLLGQRPALHWTAAAAAVAGVALTPIPLHDAEIRQGIVNEPRVYVPEVAARARREGLILRHYFEGLPVRIAIVGSQAALAYYARPAVAIESGTGLTDRWIAHQPLAKRGRVGHEKPASVSYLLRRKVNFAIRRFAAVTLRLDEELPEVWALFDTIPGRIVTWDPALMAELGRRGVLIQDVPADLDRFIAGLDRVSDERALDAYLRLKRFYFDQVNDPLRERAFRERLARSSRRDTTGR